MVKGRYSLVPMKEYRFEFSFVLSVLRPTQEEARVAGLNFINAGDKRAISEIVPWLKKIKRTSR